tara:strand:- start:4964 stop:5287 length:324 start_codon:yes stop_codon:yes gene_type:complete
MDNDIYMKSYANKMVYVDGELQQDLESERQYDGKKLRIMDRNFDEINFQELDNNDLRRLLTKPIKHRLSLKKTIKRLMKKGRRRRRRKTNKREKGKSKKKKKKKKKR